MDLNGLPITPIFYCHSDDDYDDDDGGVDGDDDDGDDYIYLPIIKDNARTTCQWLNGTRKWHKCLSYLVQTLRILYAKATYYSVHDTHI